jgi:hypothetical protein
VPKIDSPRPASTVDVMVDWDAWKVRDVKALDTNDKPVAVRAAKVYGRFAVHPCVTNPGYFAATHLPTGLSAVLTKTEIETIKVATYLWDNFCLPFCEETKEGVNEKLPGWVRYWLFACRDTGNWLNPESYKEAIRA